ncbi:MAG: type II toxin-antitoxin system HicA family toxin [Bacillus sp. (in: firmicutes)]
MKRKDLIKKFENSGWYFKRRGGEHDIYTNGKESEPIPRHKEINEMLAQKLIKKHNLK